MRLATVPHRRDINRSLRAWQRPTHREWVIELSGLHAPFVSIRTPPLLSQLDDQMRFLKHSTTRHALTRTSSHYHVHNAVFFHYIFSVLLILLWPSRAVDLQTRDHNKK